MLKTTLTFVLLLIGSQAQAHWGHDHSHWLSDAVHVVSVLAFIGVVSVGIALFRNSRKKSEEK